MREMHVKHVHFSHVSVLKHVHFLHVSVFSDSCNVQKRATKSDTSGHCLMIRIKSCAENSKFLNQLPTSADGVPKLENDLRHESKPNFPVKLVG